eukprot:355878-Chlamydomonas_euryale.AAC.2
MKHLGGLLTSFSQDPSGIDIEISRRISSARFASRPLTNHIWGSDVLSSETKSRLHNGMVVAHLIYECQTWTLSRYMID